LVTRTESVEVYVFFFDLVGFTGQFCADPTGALERLRNFQRQARSSFSFSSPHSYVVTLYDNVWCRVNAAQTGMPSLLLDFAGSVMSLAIANGYSRYFGAVTRGLHEFTRRDRILVGKEDFEDLTVQHIDITSEPHVRAAMAEKWAKHYPGSANCVWVSSEVADGTEVELQSEFQTSAYVPLKGAVELADSASGRRWPFEQRRFHLIGPRKSGRGHR
jgi:hypothetical protein